MTQVDPTQIMPAPTARIRGGAEDRQLAVSHRWWRLGWHRSDDGSDVMALVGLLSTVVWNGSVSIVPCSNPFDEDRPCPCSLHAPFDATSRAWSFGSVVVFGNTRVLSSDVTPDGERLTYVAVDGPLRIAMWCDGPQDGFTLARCGKRVRRVVPSAGIATALCRSHLKSMPRALRDKSLTVDAFMQLAAISLTGYGVTVVLGEGDAVVSPADPVPRVQTRSSVWRRRSWMPVGRSSADT